MVWQHTVKERYTRMSDKSQVKKANMNLPNKLTVLRICLVPVFMIIMMLPSAYFDRTWTGIAGGLIFIIASLTDMLDGKIARKYHLVTDFGKLMDPLADKFMVIGALTALVYRSTDNQRFFFIIALLVVVFRELAVTSLRLVASSSGGQVVAANMLGKIKTVTQIAFVVVAIAEPIIYAIPAIADAIPFEQTILPVAYVLGLAMMVMTVWSGINYFKGLWKYLDPQK